MGSPGVGGTEYAAHRSQSLGTSRAEVEEGTANVSQTEKLGVRGLAKMTHGLDPAHRDRPRDTSL